MRCRHHRPPPLRRIPRLPRVCEAGFADFRPLAFFAALLAGHALFSMGRSGATGRGAHPIRAGLVRGAGAERLRRGSTGQGPWSKGGRGESEVSPGLEVHGGHEGSPRRSRCRNSGRKSRRRSASGRVQRPKVLLWGMQRGAKLPPCQDERGRRLSGSGGVTAAHLAAHRAARGTGLRPRSHPIRQAPCPSRRGSPCRRNKRGDRHAA